MTDQGEITCILQKAKEGSKQATDTLFPLIYDQLRDIAQMRMQREKNGHTICRTELVHEAYFKLINVNEITWQDRTHFYAIASGCMRRILIDHARKKKAEKRGADNQPVTYLEDFMKIEEQADDLINLDAALKKLAKFDARLARVVECRYFGEMTIADTATALGLSVSSVKRDWTKARGWLYIELKREAE